jgi:hypothetical protein
MKKITKHVYETSDGKAFDIKADAEKHEGYLSLGKFFEEFGDAAPAQVIMLELNAFAEIIRPLIRKPRAAKAEAQADDYEAQMKKGKAA